MPDTLQNISIIELLPDSIKTDASVVASAKAIQDELAEVSVLSCFPAIYSRIDELTSDQLDHMAWQFNSKVWRDSWPVNVKRSAIKTAILEKSIKGTRKAIEMALIGIGGNSTIKVLPEQSPSTITHEFDIINIRAEYSRAGLRPDTGRCVKNYPGCEAGKINSSTLRSGHLRTWFFWCSTISCLCSTKTFRGADTRSHRNARHGAPCRLRQIINYRGVKWHLRLLLQTPD